MVISMKSVKSPTGTFERRLARYQSHLGRFAGTAKDYNPANPFEAAALGTHVVTSGFGLDAAIRDAARAVDGGSSYIPPYGQFGRTRSDISGLLDNALRLKPLSAVAAIINVPGDAIADGADFLVDVDHRKRSARSNINKVLAA